MGGIDLKKIDPNQFQGLKYKKKQKWLKFKPRFFSYFEVKVGISDCFKLHSNENTYKY